MNANMMVITKELLDVTKEQQKQIQIHKYCLCVLSVITTALLLITLL